jgi:site-specific DNA-methyltransferase (cytosine-N4-specific)
MTATIHHGHVLDVLAKLPENSVQCVVTSPPYWALRSYDTPPQVWGGYPHEHEWTDLPDRKAWSARPDHSQGYLHTTRGLQPATAAPAADRPMGAFCSCGAWRGELGLEPTPWLYLDHLRMVFDAVRRVLRKDGTLWLNLGDCYIQSGRGGQSGIGDPGTKSTLHGSRKNVNESRRALAHLGRTAARGLKAKDMVGIPWRAAFALQEDGWWLRRDIIWSKTNPMPESAKDRPTTAHEYLFLMTKRFRYYYDHKAIQEPTTGNSHSRGNGVNPKCSGWAEGPGSPSPIEHARPKMPSAGSHVRVERVPRKSRATPRQNESFSAAVTGLVENREKRSVWTIPTKPFREAHFATFPPALVEPCILAGTKKGDIVLDPFAGAGTVGWVAKRHGRDFIGVELRDDYVEMGRRRLSEGPLFDGTTKEEPGERATE